MRKFLSASLIVGFSVCGIATALDAQNLGNMVGGLFNKDNQSSKDNSSANTGGPSTAGLSESQMSSGLKEALSVGAKNAAASLSKADGFYKNAAVKILMPQEFQDVASKLKAVGMGSVVDKAVLSMNRAAEDAAGKAAPIFLNAITSISISDAAGILTGGNNAATNYLKGKTTPELTSAFTPVIKSSLSKTGTVQAWANVMNAYNKIPFVAKKQNPDLVDYVTQQALKGMFTTIAGEEAKIRTDPAAQASNLLKTVFGNK